MELNTADFAGIEWSYCFEGSGRLLWEVDPLHRVDEDDENETMTDQCNENVSVANSSHPLREELFGAGPMDEASAENHVHSSGTTFTLMSGPAHECHSCAQLGVQSAASSLQGSTRHGDKEGNGVQGAITEAFFMAVAALEAADLVHCSSFRDLQRLHPRVMSLEATVGGKVIALSMHGAHDLHKP